MPGTTAPDLAALRAAVYRPGATAADIEALEQALAQQPSAAPPETASSGPASAEVDGDPSTDGNEAPSAGTAPAPVRPFRGRRWAAVAVVAATVAGSVAGAALVLLARPAGASAAAVPTVVHIDTVADEAVFERAQRPSDRPGVPLDPSLVPSSLRRLLIAGRIELYGARDTTGRRCLVGVQGGTVSSCTTPARFRSTGIRMLWSSDVRTMDPASLRELRFRLSLVAEWRPDGKVTLGAVRR